MFKPDKFLSSLVIGIIVIVLLIIFYYLYTSQKDTEVEEITRIQYMRDLGIDPEAIVPLMEEWDIPYYRVGLFQEYRGEYVELDTYQSPYYGVQKEIKEWQPVILTLSKRQGAIDISEISSVIPVIREVWTGELDYILNDSLNDIISVIWVNNEEVKLPKEKVRELVNQLTQREEVFPYETNYSFRGEVTPIKLSRDKHIGVVFFGAPGLSYVDRIILSHYYTPEEKEKAYQIKLTLNSIVDETIRRAYITTKQKEEPLLVY